MKKENNGITPTDWALSIFGILVLLCLIVIPPVFRIAFKEKAKPVDPDKPVVEYMTCTKNNFSTEGRIQNVEISFVYMLNRINSYSKKTVMTFSNLELYDQIKNDCAKLSSLYSFVKDKGADYVHVPDDENLKITIEEKFDLGVFQNTEVTIPGDTDPTPVTSEYTRDDLVSDIKEDLTSSGYTCK